MSFKESNLRGRFSPHMVLNLPRLCGLGLHPLQIQNNCTYIWNQLVVNRWFEALFLGEAIGVCLFFRSYDLHATSFCDDLHAASQLLDISPTSSLCNAGLYTPTSWILIILLNLQCYILIVDHMKKTSIQSRREVLTKFMRIMNF